MAWGGRKDWGEWGMEIRMRKGWEQNRGLIRGEYINPPILKRHGENNVIAVKQETFVGLAKPKTLAFGSYDVIVELYSKIKCLILRYFKT